MKNYIIPLVVLLVTLLSCEDKAQKEIVTLHDEVMGVHDAIMPKHMELQNMQMKLKEQLTELNASGAADSAKVVTYHAAIDKIGDAVKGMDDWMHNWNMKYQEEGNEKAIAYLKEQKVIINKVQEDFVEGEEMAKALIHE